MATLGVNSLGLALSFDRSPLDCGGMCADPEPAISLFLKLFVLGVVPCAFAGVAIGGIADLSARLSPWARWIVLALLASTVVVALASLAKLLDFALVSTIPTLVAVTVLERSTRARREPPPLPPARAKRSSPRGEAHASDRDGIAPRSRGSTA